MEKFHVVFEWALKWAWRAFSLLEQTPLILKLGLVHCISGTLEQLGSVYDWAQLPRVRHRHEISVLSCLALDHWRSETGWNTFPPSCWACIMNVMKKLYCTFHEYTQTESLSKNPFLSLCKCAWTTDGRNPWNDVEQWSYVHRPLTRERT